jgi:hypothetical protein
MRQDELAKAVKRLGGLSEAEVSTIEMMSHAIVNKMLHAPTAVLKSAATEKDGYMLVEAVRRLYGLDADHETLHRVRGLRALLRRNDPAPKEDEGDTVGC